MKIAIVGYGLEGRAAYEYWKEQGEITICDSKIIDVPEGAKTQIGENYLANLSHFDVIVRSPSIKPRDLLSAGGPDIKDRITTNTNEFFRVTPTANIIGVTGTKGKGTTSSLIARLLKSAGYRVHLGGNIGVPPLTLLKNNIAAEDWIILELSSFQLIDINHSPRIAVCLMVVPEHLDWHNDTNEYFSAKAQMFKHQTDRDVAIYYADNKNSIAIASYSKGLKIPYFAEPGAIVKDGFIHIAGHDVCRTSELSLIGKHNWQNVCAAITTVWQITQDIAIIRKVLIAFTGLEHRLEYITEVNNVKYFDDSFGTTPETAIVAIEAFDAPKIVILGGSDKGASFTELAKVIKLSNVRAAMTIGSEGPKIEEALTKEGFTSLLKGGANMQEIVSAVSRAACPGDVVLLSPGCASFDMFTNYKERGDKFKQAVLEFAQDA